MVHDPYISQVNLIGECSQTSWSIMKYCMALFIMLMLIQVPTYEQGIKILETQGSNAAIEYFIKATEQTNDPAFFFGLAWSFKQGGELKRAEETCRFLLSKNPPPEVLTRANYLLGYILVEQGEAKGEEYLRLALDSYQKTGNKMGEFNCLMGLGYWLIRNNVLDEADRFLDRAYQLNRNEKLRQNLGYFFSLKSRLAYVRKSYKAALEYARQSGKEYARAKLYQKEISQKVSVAFFSLLLGRYPEAYKIMNEVDKVVLKNDWTKYHVFNAVNWILYYKCHNEPFDHLLTYATEWLDKNNDPVLRTHLEATRNHCR